MTKKIPYKLMSEESGDTVTVYLYGVIGQRPSDYTYPADKTEDITDMEFLKLVRKYEAEGKARLDIRINSPGGSTMHLDGIVAQMQTTTMEVHTYVDGIAASAAADIWLAAKKGNRHMAKNAKLMIHAPIDACYGNALAMEECAEKLRKFEDSYVAQMAADTGQSEDEVRATYYDGKDHWLTAKDCEKAGLIDKTDEYEAEKMPAEPEKMSTDALFNFFEEGHQTQAVGIFKQLYHLAFPTKKAENLSPNTDEEMNIDNITKAIQAGEVSEAELLAALGAEKKAAPAPPPPPAPEPSIEDTVKKLVETAVAPLQDIIKQQAEQIEKLGQKPGAGPTRVPGGAAGADTDPDEGDDEDILKALNGQLERAVTAGEPLKVGGYGTGTPAKR